MSDRVHPAGARDQLPLVGQLLYDVDPQPVWDHDTATLSAPLRRLRYHYREFAEVHLAPLALAADRDPDFVDVEPLFRKSAAAGLQTEFMPPPWGTMQLSAVLGQLLLPAALKAEELCAADGGLGLALLAHDLGIAPLFVSGDLVAYFKWLGRICREIRAGEPAIAAFAITEPNAGSDVQDTAGARQARLGCSYVPDGSGFRISGRKVFISGGAAARWVTLFAAEKGRGVESWTCFLLDKSMPGFSVGRHERKMGQRAADASELVCEDVYVGGDRVVGKVGGGWAINRNVLNFSRPVVGAIALGIARGAFEHATRFCNETRLGGRHLVGYPEVQLTLADMLLKLSAMRAMVWQATRYRLPFQAAGAMTKVFCSDTAWQVCNQALTLLGDHGYVHAAGVEKAARDARLTQIYEGTNQINRLAIFEGQLGAEFGSECAHCAAASDCAAGEGGHG